MCSADGTSGIRVTNNIKQVPDHIKTFDKAIEGGV